MDRRKRQTAAATPAKPGGLPLTLAMPVAAMKGKADPILDFVLTPHASYELRRRGLDETMVRRVLAHPEQRIAVRSGRDVVNSRVEIAGRRYLVRVFVDVDRSPAEVVTAYRTSKIGKYWRRQP